MKNDHQITNTIIHTQITSASSQQLQMIRNTLEASLTKGNFDADRATKNQALKALDQIDHELMARSEVTALRATG